MEIRVAAASEAARVVDLCELALKGGQSCVWMRGIDCCMLCV